MSFQTIVTLEFPNEVGRIAVGQSVLRALNDSPDRHLLEGVFGSMISFPKLLSRFATIVSL